MYTQRIAHSFCSNWSCSLQQSGKRQDLSDFDASGALTSESVNTFLDLGSKGVSLVSGVADLAAKIKSMITGKREELLARGVDVDDIAINLALAHIL
jgi:hypothetical protein